MNSNPFEQPKQVASKNEQEIQNNPNYRTFQRVNQDIQDIINRRSVVSNAAAQQNERYANPTWQTFFDGNILALPLATNKNERITQYRRIANYDLCNWCFDEIADEFIHEDEFGDFIKLTLPERLNSIQQDILQNEFRKFIDMFKLKENGFNLVKRFLTEGELAWENVINPKYPDMGIIGVKFLPAEYYETLIDTKTSQPVGIVFDVESFSNDVRTMYMNSFQGAASIFNAISPTTYSFQFSKETCVPLLYSQITYINSGEYSHDFLITYPMIEKAKAAYYKLALLEDAAVILRVTHAPERLLFNISTGKMTNNYADEYVRRFAAELKSKKTPTPDGSDIGSVYYPVTMLKSYVFGKSDGNDGTSVESVGSSASYDEMGDIEYFLRKFLKEFKIPFSRYKTPENTMEKNDSISYEEHSFSRMVIRFQRRFADGFKKSFITHLKLKDIWDKEHYELKESDLNIEFMKPVLYDIYEQQKLVEAKMAIYNACTSSNDEMSKSLHMKKFLGMSDKDIEDNYKALMKEKMMTAVGDMFAEKVSAENPPVDYKSPVRLKNDVEEEEKLYSGGKPESSDESGSSNGGEESGEEESNEEESGGEETQEAETPTFGLG